MIQLVFDFSDAIDDGRNSYDILSALMEEVGELATEVGIDQGYKDRDPSPDGIVGEAVDVIICALDMIRVNYPNITPDDLMKVARVKCEKWFAKKKDKLPSSIPARETNISYRLSSGRSPSMLH